ncbi:MAG: T9SS type A sorting domain-containing protein [Flavobacteriales bacterium]|nr:T9SS type A sorting domain-containing protein [Flavobacteriales bacterium]
MKHVLFLAVLCSGSMQAQTGPGGVGSSTTNALWLRADRGVYRDAGTNLATNGENVFQWNDMSGNALFASEPFSVNRPDLRTGVLNAQPVVRYTAASNDRLMVSGLTSGNQASVWVVARHTSLPSPNPGLIQGSSTGNAYSASANLKHVGMWVNSTNTQPWGRGVRSDGTELNITQTTATTSGTFYILNNDYGATTIQQYINNATAGSVATNGTLRSWSDMAIGVQAGTEGWNGDIAEVIAFNVSLNSVQRIIVANYLAAKYGLGLTTSDLYLQDNPGNGNYDHDVAGIGRLSSTNLHTDARGSGIVQISKAGHAGLGDNEFLIWGHDNRDMDAWGVTDYPPTIQGRVARVWRVNEVNTSGTAVDVGNVDITFDLAGMGSVTAGDLRLLVDTDNDGLFADETPISGATNPSGTLYRFSAVNALANNRRFSLGTANAIGTPLPIELIAFNARPVGARTVRTWWSTATETNNAGFQVERSIDLITWDEVAGVVGAVNSSAVLHYEAYDEEAPAGTVYYRLRQTDLDGRSEVFDPVAVRLDAGADDDLLVYPNPIDGPMTVVLGDVGDAQVQFQLCDARGREVSATLEPMGLGAYRLATGHLMPGSYVLRVQLPGQVRTARLVR